MEGDQFSLWAEGDGEAARHKWLESEKVGRDLGELAREQWYSRHWPEHCRKARIAHVAGERKYVEFSDRDFGSLPPTVFTREELWREIRHRLERGAENLGVINWGLSQGLDMDLIIEILTPIDINAVRFPPKQQ